MTLRSATVEAPKRKPKGHVKWNTDTKQLDYPATKSQAMYLRDLCRKLNVDYVRPNTKGEAGVEIDRLVRRRNAEAQKRKRRRQQRNRELRRSDLQVAPPDAADALARSAEKASASQDEER